MVKDLFWQSKKYIDYRMKSHTRFKVHSPFVFDLVERVFKDNAVYPDYKLIEDLKKKLSKEKSAIKTVDFGKGAGNQVSVSSLQKVGSLVKKRSQQKKQGRLLYRLSRYLQPKTILEFGTAAGMSAAYLKLPVPKAQMITMEGCSGMANVAKMTLDDLNIENIEIKVGNFEQVLPEALNSFDTLDLVFFDGNHREKPTLDYFSKCLEKVNENSCFVFDDIHWSPGMEKAWKTLIKNQNITVSIDLFWCGIVFFRKGITKQDFILRY